MVSSAPNRRSARTSPTTLGSDSTSDWANDIDRLGELSLSGTAPTEARRKADAIKGEAEESVCGLFVRRCIFRCKRDVLTLAASTLREGIERVVGAIEEEEEEMSC